MLYAMHEMQNTALQPLMGWAQVMSTLFSDPVSPLAYSPLSQDVAAGCDLLYRLGKNYDKPRFEIESTLFKGKQVGIRETIVRNKPFCQLRHFSKKLSREELDAATHPAVLLVAPLSGHYSTLLRETVKGLLHDHDVYITDWIDARKVPLAHGQFHLHDYVHYVQDFIGHLGPDVHVVAICQPTVPVLGAVALMASAGQATPRTLTLMGGPIDGRISPTKVNKLAMEKPYSWFENNVIHTVPAGYPGAGRTVYPGFLQYAAFVAMHPDKHMQSYVDFFKERAAGRPASAHLKFYDEYNAVLDMDADFYLETIKVVFQDFSLATGTWDVKNEAGALERVRPQDITQTAVFSVEGELDDITGIGQTSAVHAMCSGVPQAQHQHLEIKGAGHYGIFSGHRWHDVTYPALKSFILAHNG